MLVIKHKLLILFLILSTSFTFAEDLQTKQLDILFDSLSKIDNIDDADLIEKKIWALFQMKILPLYNFYFHSFLIYFIVISSTKIHVLPPAPKCQSGQTP